jgi:hypothetical protein
MSVIGSELWAPTSKLGNELVRFFGRGLHRRSLAHPRIRRGLARFVIQALVWDVAAVHMFKTVEVYSPESH